MDCDTTGVEPDFAIVKYKKLAGGGYFKIINKSVQIALKNLNYSDDEILEIEKYTLGNAILNIEGQLILENCPAINCETLKARGFSDDVIANIDSQLKDVFDIRFAFNKFSIGEPLLHKVGLTQKEIDDPNTDFLTQLGFTDDEIEKANDYLCGTMMLEGAPYLKSEHLNIFDCASKCGKKGERYIPYMAHLNIMSAVQPFITGAISKTVNMPQDATIEEITNVHITA